MVAEIMSGISVPRSVAPRRFWPGNMGTGGTTGGLTGTVIDAETSAPSRGSTSYRREPVAIGDDDYRRGGTFYVPDSCRPIRIPSAL